MRRKVAILGAGIGEKHLVAYVKLADRFEVTHICDLNTELAMQLASQVEAKVTDDLQLVLSDTEVEIVDICLPPPLHVPVALQALAQRKHIILEKPIAGSLNDADKLVKAEAESEGKIFPVFQYRYGRAFNIMNQLREAGFLSRPLTASLETHWDRRSDYYEIPWHGTWKRELGGAVLSHAIHAHDLLSLTFGPVSQVSAFTATRANPIETEDCASIAFRLENGSTATSSITLGAAGNSSRIRLVFDDMTIESNSEEAYAYAPGEANWVFKARDTDRQQEVDAILGATMPGLEGFVGFCAAIADALDGKSGSEVTLKDGVAAIELATAIYHSDRTRTQVSLPFDRNLPICSGLIP